tara:strand:- start:120 stop:311 length:192 start_codon:yes stop_codon:yes gene_type:complete
MRERRIKQDVANQRVGTPLYMGSEDVRVERSEKITYFAYKKFGMLDFFGFLSLHTYRPHVQGG